MTPPRPRRDGRPAGAEPAQQLGRDLGQIVREATARASTIDGPTAQDAERILRHVRRRSDAKMAKISNPAAIK